MFHKAKGGTSNWKRIEKIDRILLNVLNFPGIFWKEERLDRALVAILFAKGSTLCRNCHRHSRRLVRKSGGMIRSSVRLTQ